MKKTYTFTVEYNEEGSELLERLNMTHKHACELINAARKDAEARDEGDSDKPFDSFNSLIDLLDSNTLDGNDILFHLLNGYTAELKMDMMKDCIIKYLVGSDLGALLGGGL